MAYQEPDTAAHHLKMVQAYLDEADKLDKKEKEPNQFTSDSIIKALALAAEHLNKARAIDPNEVLWVENEKGGTKSKIDQDFLNGQVLTHEGVAQLNAARYLSKTYRTIEGTVDRKPYDQGVNRLQQARDALEKALTYRPYSDDTLTFLAESYRLLGDTQNYRRVLERHVEICPENMELHTELEKLKQTPAGKPLFRPRGFSLSAPMVFSGMLLLGIALIIIGIAAHSLNAAGFGILLLVGSGIGFAVYEKFF